MKILQTIDWNHYPLQWDRCEAYSLAVYKLERGTRSVPLQLLRYLLAACVQRHMTSRMQCI